MSLYLKIYQWCLLICVASHTKVIEGRRSWCDSFCCFDFILNFMAGGCHSSLWPKSTTFLMLQSIYLWPDAATVHCNQRPQHFKSHRNRRFWLLRERQRIIRYNLWIMCCNNMMKIPAVHVPNPCCLQDHLIHR